MNILRFAGRALAWFPAWFWFSSAFALAGGAGFAVGAWRNICNECPSLAEIVTFEPDRASNIYAADGALIGQYFQQRRTPVRIEDLPPHVPNAFIAVEDRRFYEHHGLDWRGIFRAGLEAIGNLSLSGAGGSTITQQLARNQHLTFQKRVVRKLREWQIAMDLEREYSKAEILEAYMNQVNFARGRYGIETASWDYFGKPAVEMDPAEAALLAAMVRRPEAYQPFQHPERAKERRDLVLQLMEAQGYLGPGESEAWREKPVPAEGEQVQEGAAPYFAEWVRQILEDRYGADLYRNGLRIYTTLDPAMQEAAEAAMRSGWSRIENLPDYDRISFDDAILDEAEDGEEGSSGYLQGAFVAIDPHTGYVRAMVGGRDFGRSKFNRVLQARRQAGSSFKAFVYIAALRAGYPASSIFQDAPVVIPQVDGTVWRPTNYDPEFLGPMTMREGLRRSQNLIAIRVGQAVGMESVAQTATDMGLRTEIERFPSTAIGAAEVIPIEMASAYSALAAMGSRAEPQPIIRVESERGDVLWEPGIERTVVLDSATARIALSMLQDVVANGTGRNLRLIGGLPEEVPAAGKTGTTNDETDAWFVGVTPNLAAAVWLGVDEKQSIAPRATGGFYASPIWGEFMRRVYYDDLDEDEPRPSLPIPEAWGVPEGLVTLRVDGKTGLLASRWCPAEDAYYELFARGTEPTEVCDRSGG